MIVDFTFERVFGHDGPNLCLLGSEGDFRRLAEKIADLTAPSSGRSVTLNELDFVALNGIKNEIIFSSEVGAKLLGTIVAHGHLVFRLDSRYWERIFKFFVLMSWDKRTYYLNMDDSSMYDLDLIQECNLICSSEF